MQIIYISDGKAGHRSQALGLYAALKKKYEHVCFLEQMIDQLSYAELFKGWCSKHIPQLKNAPTLIVAVGSHTHLKAWLLGKVYPKAQTIVLMKPSLPVHYFDYAVIPEHDEIHAKNVIVTKGALNPIVNEHRHQKNRILVALGGSSKRHRWSDDQVIQSLKQIAENHLDAEIIITSSRRTPHDFLNRVRTEIPANHLVFYPVNQTPMGWIFEQMQLAEAVWITEDSISMVYEALTAGCRVGVIALPRLKEDRITTALDHLKENKYVSDQLHLTQLETVHALHEADDVVAQLQLF